ncbi:MAG: tyrosine-type recombinase/integrase [Deltaproteobacteria bacterium]|nr:tyrosine-type recombinase/integrase [Deltaproteobacteria bacterium]
MFKPSLPKYMTQEEVEQFFSTIEDQRDKALFSLIYHYGLRVGEATLLNLADVDLRRNKILIKRIKGGVSGEKPLWKDTKRLLKTYLQKRNGNNKALFTGRQGRLGRRRIQQLFIHYARKASFKNGYSVHSLRHSIAVHILDAGEAIEFVQDHLGHRNVQNTQIYSKISDRKRKEIFEKLERSSEIVRF